MTTFETIDLYIASFPPDVRPTLEAVRAAMRDAVPGTEEAITYGIPTFTLNGKYVVYFAGWKRYISVYPIPGGDPALDAELAPYKASKGTLRFPLNKPIPLDLIAKAAALLLKQARGRAAR